jgi:hypothetical protein
MGRCGDGTGSYSPVSTRDVLFEQPPSQPHEYQQRNDCNPRDQGDERQRRTRPVFRQHHVRRSLHVPDADSVEGLCRFGETEATTLCRYCTTRFACAISLPDDAATVTVPVVRPCTWPGAIIVVSGSDDRVQLRVFVISAVVPSLNVPIA